MDVVSTRVVADPGEAGRQVVGDRHAGGRGRPVVRDDDGVGDRSEVVRRRLVDRLGDPEIGGEDRE